VQSKNHNHVIDIQITIWWCGHGSIYTDST